MSMLGVLRTALRVGRVTTSYPTLPSPAPPAFRGAPVVDPARCNDLDACLEAAARVCPAGAIAPVPDPSGGRGWQIDLAPCVFCGLCAEACPSGAISMSGEYELATRSREDLLTVVRNLTPPAHHPTMGPLDPHGLSGAERGETDVGGLGLGLDRAGSGKPAPTEPGVGAGFQQPIGESPALNLPPHSPLSAPETGVGGVRSANDLAQQLSQRVRRSLRRSLHIRHMDAGSDNGTDWELNTLLNPVYDMQRLGIDVVASPRHADVLFVTGPVTRNLAAALRRTYEAMPRPGIVIAAGAEACGGGVLQGSYAHAGGVDAVLPVDVYIPGDPPRPEAIIYGLLLAMERVEQKRHRVEVSG